MHKKVKLYNNLDIVLAIDSINVLPKSVLNNTVKIVSLRFCT
jgi:hypothetical protein